MVSFKFLKQPETALIIFAIWTALFVGILAYENAFDSKFLQFGPGKDKKNYSKFLNWEINSWKRVILLMCIGFFSTILSSYYHNIVNPWIMNQMMDPKTEVINKNSFITYMIGYINPIFTWTNNIITFFITLTMQLQYILPRVLADMILSFFLTNAYLDDKKFAN